MEKATYAWGFWPGDIGLEILAWRFWPGDFGLEILAEVNSEGHQRQVFANIAHTGQP